ncbi:MAG: hypothetical protein II304_03130 [Bacteroidales bacterium]|nr:hypothetical protein [Bacteroidales bacterium]
MSDFEVTVDMTNDKSVVSIEPVNGDYEIDITQDISYYNSKISKDWAVKMDGKVNSEDYSSKYYANVSAQNAQISQANAQACEDARVLLQGEFNEYSENLLETKTNAVDEINTLTDNSISELQTKSDDLQSTADSVVATGKNELQTELSNLRTSASSITSTSKTDIQNTATSAKNTAISAIQSQQTTSVNAVKTEGTTQVNLAKAQATAAANSATQASNVVKQVEDDLDSKVDIDDMVEVDFVDITDAGATITTMAMPDIENMIQISLPYTAPCDGLLYIYPGAALNAYYGVNVTSGGKTYAVFALTNAQSNYSSANGLVPKGANLTLSMGGGTSYFIPLKGAN